MVFGKNTFVIGLKSVQDDWNVRCLALGLFHGKMEV